MRQNFKVPSISYGMQIGSGGTAAFGALHGVFVARKTFLLSTVKVIRKRKTGLLTGLHEAIQQQVIGAVGFFDPQWSTVAALVVAAGAVWGLTLVWYPAWLDGKGEATVAAAEVLALVLTAAALRRGGAGGPAPEPGRLLALAGLGLYLVTDLSYLEHAARGDPSFCVPEIGFYAGYLAVALTGVVPREADTESRAEARPPPPEADL